MKILRVMLIVLGFCVASIASAAAPKITPFRIEFTDAGHNSVNIAEGKPFIFWVHFTYQNPTTNHYRISAAVADTTTYSGAINWGAGGSGTHTYIFGQWMQISKPGAYHFTVKVDCDDAIPGAQVAVKSKSISINVMPRLPSYDFSRWQQMFEAKLKNDGAGGFAWLGLENGSVRMGGSGGYGRAPWEPVNPSVPFTPSNPMHLASISKLITWVGLGKLWEMKRGTGSEFSYDDRVSRFLSNSVPNLHPSLKEMTVFHVSQHQTGLTNGFGDLESMQAALSQPAAWKPGTREHYFNGNYFLLAHIIEQISGQRYADFVRVNILVPLGMTNTSDNATEVAPTLIYGPAQLRKPGALMTITGTELAGAYGWWSSAEDLAKLLSGIRYGTIFRPETISKVGLNAGVWFWAGGWGWGDGATLGYLSTCVARLSDSVDAVLLINSDKGNAPALLQEAFALPQQGWRLEPRFLGGKLTASFMAHAGFSYNVEVISSLVTGGWVTNAVVAGSNRIETVTLPASRSHQFLRVRQN